MDRAKKIVRVEIGGRVQGVGFRAFVQRQAETRCLTGWVRNRRSGDVEAVFAGPADDVTAVCESCRQGPQHAHVERFEIFDADDRALAEIGDGFRQRATL